MVETLDTVIRSMAACGNIIVVWTYLKENPVLKKRIAVILYCWITLQMIFLNSVLIQTYVRQSSDLQLLFQITIAFYSPLVVWGILETCVPDFQLRPWHFLVLPVSLTFIALDYRGLPGPDPHVVNLLCWGALVYYAIQNGMIKKPRISRSVSVWFVGITGVIVLTMIIHVAIYETVFRPAVYSLVHGMCYLFLILLFAHFALRIREGTVLFGREDPSRTMILPKGLSPAEAALLRRLSVSMDEGMWKVEGLTIGQLAEALETPEHRLRKVINTGLGHRNFAEYLNAYRLEEAQKMLADPHKADIPIVQIASELGYASLGPFNRAFRDKVGKTPSEFRKHQLVRVGDSATIPFKG